MPSMIFLLQRLLYLAPWMLVQAAGIALAIIYYRRYPKPALLVLCACLLLICESVVVTVCQYFVFAMSPSAMSSAMMIVSLLDVMMRSTAFGILLAAAFIGRQPNPVIQSPFHSGFALPPLTATIVDETSQA